MRQLFPCRNYSMALIIPSILSAVLFSTASSIAADKQQAAIGVLDPKTPLINGAEVTVTVADYQQGLLALSPEQRSTIERDPELGQQLLFEIYTERMLEREARRRGLDQQAEVQARIAQIPRKILVNTIVEQERSAMPNPDFTALAEEYYQAHQQDYVQPEQIQVAHILWSLKCDCQDGDGVKRAQAEQVLKELQGGAGFADLARQYSEDKGSAVRGGDLGQWYARGSLVKPFEDAAFALLQPGALSPVIKTEHGYHIIKLLGRQAAGTQPFEQVKGKIVEELAKKYRSGAQKAFVGKYYPTGEQFNKSAINAVLNVKSSLPSAVPH